MKQVCDDRLCGRLGRKPNRKDCLTELYFAGSILWPIESNPLIYLYCSIAGCLMAI